MVGPGPATAGGLALSCKAKCCADEDPVCNNAPEPCEVCIGDTCYFKLAVRVVVPEDPEPKAVCGCLFSADGIGGSSDEAWVVVPEQGWFVSDDPVTVSVAEDTDAEYCSGTPPPPRWFGPGTAGPYNGPAYVTVEVPDATDGPQDP